MKTLRTFSTVILVIAFLSLFGFCVRHVALDGKRLGIFTKPLVAFSSFPKTVYKVLTSKEIKGVSLTYTLKDTSFEHVNRLNYNVFGLNSFYSCKTNIWEIKLFNFINDSVIYEWMLHEKDFFKTGDRLFKNARPKNPVLLNDRSLITVCVESNNLYRLNRDSKIIWHNTDKNYHHSLNLSADSNLWACTSDKRSFILGRMDKQIAFFRDDFITKIDIETGKIIYDKSVSDILIENGYKNLVYGFTNFTETEDMTDPLHLNDIQPVIKDGAFWEKGDVFLSLRHKSIVIHYRPTTNKIIRLIQGPFLFQHDVDIFSDSEIAIFNNNTTNIGEFELVGKNEKSSFPEYNDALLHSEIIIYDYKDSSFRTILGQQFVSHDIYSRTEGSYAFLTTGDIFVESQNDAKVFIMNEKGLLFKKQFNTSTDHLVHLPNWMRIYENVNF